MVDKNKTTGYVVFALGIVLLVGTFYLAVHTYLNPEFVEPFSDLVEIEEEGLAQFVNFLIYLIPVLFLFVMGSIAGKITKYGINMITSPERKSINDVEQRRRPSRTVQTQVPPPSQDDTDVSEKERPQEPTPNYEESNEVE